MKILSYNVLHFTFITRVKRRRNWLTHCATRREVAGSIPGRLPGNFQVAYFLRPLSVALGSTQPVPRNFLWGKVRPAHLADSFAVPVVPYV